MFSQILPINGNWRFEVKYRLPLQKYFQVRNAILPYMKMDPYTRKTSPQRYLVRSLYFDTHDYLTYHEKVEGDSDRIKLRIRTYSRSPERSTDLRVELKTRKGVTMEKHSTWVTMDQYQEFIRTGRWLTDCQDPILDEFERYVHLKTLQPKIIVEYLREGYQSRNTDNIRLTFDHQVQSACAKTLFPDAPFFRGHHRGVIILEIKCNKRQPEWLRSLVQAHGLRIMANSKFVQGITLASPDIVTPVWSS